MYDQACFADRSLRDEEGALDFLGLFAVNRRLIAQCLPGINGNVSRVRVYAAFCWMAWRLEEDLTDKDEHVDLIHRHAMQKIDLVLMWSMQGNKGQGLVGGDRTFPSDTAPVEFLFDSFTGSQAAYLRPAEYRPSLVDGLGLLQAGRNGSYRCHPEGKRLALALDVVIRSQVAEEDYAWLADVRQLSGTGAQAKTFKFLLTTPLTIEEQQAFLAAFMRTGLDLDPSDARRTATCRLILRAFSQSPDGLNLEQLRASLARGTDGQGRSLLRLSDGEREQAVLYHQAVLRLRQLQRYALEYCVSQLLQYLCRLPLREGAQTLKGLIIGFLAKYLTDSDLTSVGSLLSVDTDLQELDHLRGDAPTLALAALTELGVPSFAAEKSTVYENGEQLLLAQLYLVLLRCKAETDNLLRLEPGYRHAMEAETHRLPLPLFSQALESLRSGHPRELMAHVLEHFCVHQQVRTAASRTKGPSDTNRFLFVQGETGWTTPFKKRKLKVRPTADRIGNTCKLLHESGLLKGSSFRWFLTEEGLAQLD